MKPRRHRAPSPLLPRAHPSRRRSHQQHRFDCTTGPALARSKTGAVGTRFRAGYAIVEAMRVTGTELNAA
jgi:hypothetical protein